MSRNKQNRSIHKKVTQKNHESFLTAYFICQNKKGINVTIFRKQRLMIKLN